MSNNAKIVLGGLGLSILILLLFSIKTFHYSPSHTSSIPVSVDHIATLIGQGQYAVAYTLLQTDQTPQADKWQKQKRTFQLAFCERALAKPDSAYTRLQTIETAHPEIEEHRRFWMARTLAEMGEGAAAISAYHRLLQTTDHPSLLDSIYIHLPKLYIDADDYNAALDLYHESLDRTPAWQPALLYRMAQAYDALGQTTKARQKRINLINRFPAQPQSVKALEQLVHLKTADEIYASALVYRHNNRRHQTLKILKDFIITYPDHPNIEAAHFLLARTYSLDKQYDQAEKIFSYIHKTYKQPSALYRLGGIQVRRNRDLESIKIYELFVKLYPQHELAPHALWQAAKAAERHNQFDQAHRLYKLLSTQYSASSQGEEAGWSVGFMHYCQKNFELALASFRQHSNSAHSPHLIDQSLFWAAKTATHLKQETTAQTLYARVANNYPRSYYATRAVSMGYGTSLKHRRPAPQSTIADPLPLLALEGSAFVQRATLFDELGLPQLARGELLIAERMNKSNLQALGTIRQVYETLGFWDRSLTLAVQLANRGESKKELHQLYPNYYWQLINTAAVEAAVDPHLVLSVIRQESFFNHKAVSPAGALGLMQIMPKTGRTIANQLGQDDFKRRDLFEPSLSIRFGSFYLGERLRAFSPNPQPHLGYELGLAAYNAGPHNAHAWLKRFPYDDPDVFIERIPYKETRLYIKKVLKNYTIYKALARQSNV